MFGIMESTLSLFLIFFTLILSTLICNESAAGCRQGEHSCRDCSGSRGEDSGRNRGGRGSIDSGEESSTGKERDGNVYVIVFVQSTGGA